MAGRANILKSNAPSQTREALLVFACVVLWCLSCGALSAGAAVQHVFLPDVSARIGEGAPAGSGVPGVLGGVNALAVDSGHVWVADNMNSGAFAGKSRVSEFDDSTGGFLGQLVEEGGVNSLANPLAVGHVGVEELEYVVSDREGAEVVSVYSGLHLVAVWTGAHSANGSFTLSGGAQVGSLVGVAVDDSGNPGTSGDVYVATHGRTGAGDPFNVVDVFKGEVGGGEPVGTVGELKGTCASAGVCPGKEIPFEEPEGVTVSGLNGDVFVTDGKHKVDVFAPLGGGEYSFVRELTGTPAGVFSNVVGVGVDAGNGEIYVVDQSAHAVDEFSPEGVFLGRLEGTGERGFNSVTDVGVDGESHRVYVTDFDSVTGLGSVDVFGPDVVVPDVETLPDTGATVEKSGGVGVTLNGTVDLAGAGEASCRFEYGTTEKFGDSVPCAKTVTQEPGAVAVSARLTGLPSDSRFFYRLAGSNKNGLNSGEAWQDHSFLTPGPGLVGEGVANVSATSATFQARLDPHGAATSFYFQYSASVSTGECEAQLSACTSLPLAPGEAVGSGEEVLAEQVHAQNLLPDTLYHYRLLAVSRVEPEPEAKPKVFETVTFPAPDESFTTQAANGGFLLPDGRAWELVSPVDKHGASLYSPGGEPGDFQAASSGGMMTYPATSATKANTQGYSESVQVLSTRTAGGWASTNLALPHAGAVGAAIGTGLEYRAFSEDLSYGLVEPQGPFTSLHGEAFPPDSERTPYLRDNQTCPTESGDCYQPLVTSVAGHINVPEGTKFGGSEEAERGEVHYDGASGDLKHAILKSKIALTVAKTPGEGELYEWSAGKPPSEQLHLVSILPTGQPASTEAFLGFADKVARNAISADGSRVIWSEEGGTTNLHLYEYYAATGKSVQLDVPQGGDGAGTSEAHFQAASDDGKRVFFTDTQRLTSDAAAVPRQRDLYECEIEEANGEPSCDLHNLTPLQGNESADVQGTLIAASQDGTRVYFAANGVLAQGATRGGCNSAVTPTATCNLYEMHYENDQWHTKLVARVSGVDYPDWNEESSGNLAQLTAGASPDGQWLAFMSSRDLAGYNNIDASTGSPDEEVYLYHATTGKLTCVSCDPSGAEPKGVAYGQVRNGLVGGTSEIWPRTQGLAASLPGWTPFEVNKARYQPRYLSNSGRVFFDSADALVPQDINNNQDVYEYEPVGDGTCAASSSTYSPSAEGCASLISSGTSGGESVFVDASETGDDVFFLTGEKLAPTDIDTALDLYDAHVCTPQELCPNVPAPSPACTTADSCRPAPIPQPSIFGQPSSTTFTGPGNPKQPTPTVIRPRTLTRAQKLARALTACHKKKAKHKRTACKRQANKRYRTATGSARKQTTKKKR
jgi:hypothetical protein